MPKPELEVKLRLRKLEEWRINNGLLSSSKEYMTKKFTILVNAGIIPEDGNI